MSKKIDEIRSFKVAFSKKDITDLRERLSRSRWPDQEIVRDQSQGVQLATLQKLADYWLNTYDFKTISTRLNKYPQFITTIDGLDIHFIHVKSKNKNALPIIITHGWPGSIIEQMKVVDLLTNPTQHGGSELDAFDVVIPSLPGHGFSEKPMKPGWNPPKIAQAWIILMKRLGYSRYVAQGGDWGNAVTELMALLAPRELVGVHTNMPATVPKNIAKLLLASSQPPANLTADEQRAYRQLDAFYSHGLAYAQEMSQRPQTLYGIEDSPIGLAAWMLDHDARSYDLIARVFDGKKEGLTKEDILDNITLYWLTKTGISAARLYWEAAFAVPSRQLAFFEPTGIKKVP